MNALFFTDNGRVLCYKHLGAAAKYTGRDISGQAIERVTEEHMDEADALGHTLSCEDCDAAERAEDRRAQARETALEEGMLNGIESYNDWNEALG